MMQGSGALVHHSIHIFERKRAELDGVGGILSFDESVIALETALGRLVIEGKDLKVENLSKENGKILITGEIIALYYENKREKRGLFSSGRK